MGVGNSMDVGRAIRTCLSKYATLSGRASRSEYWFFGLFLLVVSLVRWLIDIATGSGIFSAGIGGSIIDLVLLLPTLAIWVRRLHDINRTGWWSLFLFVSVISPWIPPYYMHVLLATPNGEFPTVLGYAFTVLKFAFILLLALVTMIIALIVGYKRGTVGPNRYGPVPLASATDLF